MPLGSPAGSSWTVRSISLGRNAFQANVIITDFTKIKPFWQKCEILEDKVCQCTYENANLSPPKIHSFDNCESHVRLLLICSLEFDIRRQTWSTWWISGGSSERLLGRLDFDSFNFASLYIHLLIKSLEFYIEHVVDIRRVVWMRNTTDYLGDASHPNTLGFARQKPGLTLTSLLSRFFSRICLPLSLSGGPNPTLGL